MNGSTHFLHTRRRSSAWTAKAGGPAGNLGYTFRLYRTSTGWSIGQDYSAANTWTWTPTASDTYAVLVWVRVPGAGTDYDAWQGSNWMTVTTGAVSSIGLTVNQTFPVASNSPITWTASASGGSATFQYKFQRYDANTGSWTIVRDWSTTKTCTWAPPAAQAGVSAIQVWVCSAGSTASYEAYVGSGWRCRAHPRESSRNWLATQTSR